MTKVILPRLNQTGANEWSDVQANDEALQTVINGELSNENIAANANIARSKLETGAQGLPGTGYTATVIATEESRANVAYGTLPTPDEVTGVSVPANGILRISYDAIVKSSASGQGNIAIFIGANVALGRPALTSSNVEVATVGTAFGRVATSLVEGIGLEFNVNATSLVTTGRVVNALEFGELGAGTYAVSVKYKAASGSITAKERILRVSVLA